jgi:hypothetical protein
LFKTISSSVLECSEKDKGCKCDLKATYIYNDKVIENSTLTETITHTTIDLQLKLENIGSEPFYPTDLDNNPTTMIIDSGVVVDSAEASSACKKETSVSLYLC